MFDELTNLLPVSNRNAFRREYFMRLATVGVFLLAFIVIAQGVFLLPSYLYEHEVVGERTSELKRLSTNLATTQEQQVQIQIKALQAESTYLLNLQNTPTASTALRAVLAVPHSGISLTGFTFSNVDPSNVTPTATKTMQISGIASTREDLSNYDSALSALPFVTNANLPISDYAKDTAIPFTITLTGSLAP